MGKGNDLGVVKIPQPIPPTVSQNHHRVRFGKVFIFYETKGKTERGKTGGGSSFNSPFIFGTLAHSQ